MIRQWLMLVLCISLAQAPVAAYAHCSASLVRGQHSEVGHNHADASAAAGSDLLSHDHATHHHFDAVGHCCVAVAAIPAEPRQLSHLHTSKITKFPALSALLPVSPTPQVPTPPPRTNG